MVISLHVIYDHVMIITKRETAVIIILIDALFITFHNIWSSIYHMHLIS